MHDRAASGEPGCTGLNGTGGGAPGGGTVCAARPRYASAAWLGARSWRSWEPRPAGRDPLVALELVQPAAPGSPSAAGGAAGRRGRAPRRRVRRRGRPTAPSAIPRRRPGSHDGAIDDVAGVQPVAPGREGAVDEAERDDVRPVPGTLGFGQRVERGGAVREGDQLGAITGGAASQRGEVDPRNRGRRAPAPPVRSRRRPRGRGGRANRPRRDGAPRSPGEDRR